MQIESPSPQTLQKHDTVLPLVKLIFLIYKALSMNQAQRKNESLLFNCLLFILLIYQSMQQRVRMTSSPLLIRLQSPETLCRKLLYPWVIKRQCAKKYQVKTCHSQGESLTTTFWCIFSSVHRVGSLGYNDHPHCGSRCGNKIPSNSFKGSGYS